MEADAHMATISRVFITAILIAMLPAIVVAAQNDLVRPDTAQGAQMLARLQQAELVDRMNYESYLGSRENEVAMYYLSKHRHVVEAIRQLQSGEPVSSEEISRALDDSEAWRYGATF